MPDKNLPDKVDELLAEVVNKDPLTLASISAVPYFGGVLATFFSAKWLEIYQERTKVLFEQFTEHLNNLDEQAIRRDYFDTPEGMDLLIRAVEESSKTRNDDKRDLITRVLRGAVLNYGRGEYSPEEYLYLISNLTVQELRVARSIYYDRPNFKSEEDWQAWEDSVCAEISIGKEDLHMALSRLASAGLLAPVIAYTDDDAMGVIISPEAHSEEDTRYVITSVFEKLMRFLELGA
jgi:hypothetical protein